MDLESTLIRAEALFYKFQRVVEAIDKNQNFPGPKGQSSTGSSNPSSGKPKVTAAAAAKGKAKEESQKVITPELRKLLSRKMTVLPRKTVADNGEGMPTTK